MIFETHQLQEPLNQYIESIFHFKGFMPDHSIERVVPTGHIFILFELDGYSRNTFDNDTLKPKNIFSNVWISGMHRNYISISAHPNSEMLVIQFKAYGAHPFFHFPIEDLNEKVIPTKRLFGNELIALRESILPLASSQEKFQLVEEWLESKFEADRTPPSDLLDLVKKLEAAPCAKCQEIMENYPNSQKHLINQFKKYVGLRPKYYQRILRFNEILQQIQKKEQIAWAQIAYNCGYADQSHFIKEFKHFSGFNPQEFIQQEFNMDETNFFPLDRKG